MPDTEFLKSLQERGYNAIVTLKNDQFAGVLAYQVHGKEWHCFALRISPAFAGQGLAKATVRQCLIIAQSAGAEIVYLWEGNKRGQLSYNDAQIMEKIYRDATENALNLPFMVTKGHMTGQLVLPAANAASAA